MIGVGVLGHGHGSGAVQKNAASEVTGPYAAMQHTMQKIGLLIAGKVLEQLKELEGFALNEVGLLSSSAEKMREQMVMVTMS